MQNRRSIRKFRPQPVPVELIDELLEAASWAPSAGNCQPWQFIRVTDEDEIEAVKMVSPGLFGEPPAVIVMCLDEKRMKATTELHYIDIGAAMQNLLLMAHYKGLGGCPIASFDPEALVEILSLPKNVHPVLLVIIGYPDQNPTAPTRLPINETKGGNVLG